MQSGPRSKLLFIHTRGEQKACKLTIMQRGYVLRTSKKCVFFHEALTHSGTRPKSASLRSANCFGAPNEETHLLLFWWPGKKLGEDKKGNSGEAKRGTAGISIWHTRPLALNALSCVVQKLQTIPLATGLGV